MRYLLFLSLSVVLFSSCGKRCGDVERCGMIFGGNHPYFTGYTFKDLDTMVVKLYEPGTNYTQLVNEEMRFIEDFFYDTIRSVNASYPHAISIVDEADPIDSFSVSFISLNVEKPNTDLVYDMELIIRSTGRTYKISDIVLSGQYEIYVPRYCDDASPGCRREPVSCKIDGITYTGYPPPFSK